MSAEEQRRLLEALMGREALHGTDIPSHHFTDDEVCKDFLCGLCPNDLFVNTKMDIGACRKVHSDRLKKDYEDARAKGEHSGYENEWAHSLAKFVAECDRKSQITLKKMDRNPDDNKALQLIQEISDIDYEVLVVMEQMQTHGEEGNMLEAIKLLHTVQFLHDRKKFVEVIRFLGLFLKCFLSANHENTCVIEGNEIAGSGCGNDAESETPIVLPMLCLFIHF
jgi:hypothetical protein